MSNECHPTIRRVPTPTIACSYCVHSEIEQTPIDACGAHGACHRHRFQYWSNSEPSPAKKQVIPCDLWKSKKRRVDTW